MEDLLPHHPILGLPYATTPQDVNLNMVTISPELYNKMADMSTINMPETQEDKDNEHNEDMEPRDNDSVCLLQWLLAQSLSLQMWTMQ
jgi:hypothetical protein